MFQARPPDYPESIFMSRVPVSFYKHWNMSPNKDYNEYFRESDKSVGLFILFIYWLNFPKNG